MSRDGKSVGFVAQGKRPVEVLRDHKANMKGAGHHKQTRGRLRPWQGLRGKATDNLPKKGKFGNVVDRSPAGGGQNNVGKHDWGSKNAG